MLIPIIYQADTYSMAKRPISLKGSFTMKTMKSTEDLVEKLKEVLQKNHGKLWEFYGCTVNVFTPERKYVFLMESEWGHFRLESVESVRASGVSYIDF